MSNTLRVYIIDTSYLAVLFKIPKYYSDEGHIAIKKLLKTAIESSSRLVVPYPCIFEIANHIAHVVDGDIRKDLAAKLYNTVSSSITEQAPWIIPPNKNNEEVLIEICKIFSERYAASLIGLTDTYIITEANAWKAKYNSSKYKVHIWTTDGSLKAHEPDTEPDAFVGV